MKPRLPIGIVYALAAAALFGASTPLSKLLLGSVDPWLLAGAAYCQVGQRGYLATRILRQRGFMASNIGGGYKTYRLFHPKGI